MGCYPVDSADARDLAEADADDDQASPASTRRIPMPPRIAAEIRRILADKRKQRGPTE